MTEKGTTCRQFQSSLDGIDKLRLATVTIPAPGSHEILVQILCVSLNYKDGETINGYFKHHKASQSPPNLVPCSDAVGRVVSVGSAVTLFKTGDRVISLSYPAHRTGQVRAKHLAGGLGAAKHGVLTEYRLFEEETVVRCPASLKDEEAATMPIAGTTAWMAINGFRGIGKPGGEGESVLIQGTGGVAIFGLIIAKASGMRVIITSSSDEKLRRAKDLGADDLINYKSTPNWDEKVLELTDGEGVDLIFENGGAQTTSKSFNCIKWGGNIASIGYVSGKIDPPKERVNINVRALMRNLTLRGLLNGPRDRFEELLEWWDQKNLNPVVDRAFDFDQSREALEYLWAGKHFGKVVIRVN